MTKEEEAAQRLRFLLAGVSERKTLEMKCGLKGEYTFFGVLLLRCDIAGGRVWLWLWCPWDIHPSASE